MGPGSVEIPFHTRLSLCCLTRMLKCQSPFDKCTKQFWVPTACWIHPGRENCQVALLPAGSCPWLLPRVGSPKTVPACQIVGGKMSSSMWPSSPPPWDKHPRSHATCPLALLARCLAHSSRLTTQRGQDCRKSRLQVGLKKNDDDIVCRWNVLIWIQAFQK